MSDASNKAQGWIAVVLAAIPGIKQLVDLFRNETIVDGLPCRLRYRKRRGYTECRHCGATFKGHALDNDAWPSACPNAPDDTEA